jgi:hypothetical protein
LYTGFIELSISYKKKIAVQIYAFVCISMQKHTTKTVITKTQWIGYKTKKYKGENSKKNMLMKSYY